MNTNTSPSPGSYTAFVGGQRIASGALPELARAAHRHAAASPLVFDDATGRVVDLDLRGSAEDAAARVSTVPAPTKAPRGRPKLGVTAREVTLLPQHWDWLAAQPGGASAALRRLVDQARRSSAGADAQRSARDATYRIMTTLAGDRPGYEDATRALFAADWARFDALVSAWPRDLIAYLARLAPR